MPLAAETRPLSKILINLCALIFGYTLWHIISTPYKIETVLSIPVSFYNTDPLQVIKAPESIQIAVAGTRAALFKAAYTASLHCDAHSLTQGLNTVMISDQQIFLPETISLVHYLQKQIPVTVTSTTTAS